MQWEYGDLRFVQILPMIKLQKNNKKFDFNKYTNVVL